MKTEEGEAEAGEDKARTARRKLEHEGVGCAPQERACGIEVVIRKDWGQQ